MRACVLWVFLLCFPLTAQAKQLQFGNIIYQMPEDWVLGKVERGTQVLLPRSRNKKCSTCRIYLGVGQLRQGGLEDFFRNTISGMLPVKDRPRLQITFGPKPQKVGEASGLLASWRVGKKIYLGFAIALRQRYEFVAIRVTWPESEAADTAGSYFEAFVKDLKYVSEGAKSLVPQARGGSLSGVFRGYYMGVGVGVGGTGTLVPKYKTLIFWRSGHFYDGTPPEGLKQLDPDSLLTSGNTSFGVYEASGRKVRLTYASGKTVEMTPLPGGGWKFGQREMLAANVLSDGSRVSGTVSSMMFGGFSPGSGVTGASAASSSIRLFENGTYTSNTALSTGGSFGDGGGFAGGGTNETAGTYSIRDGLIRFTPVRGKPLAPQLVYQYLGETYIGERMLK